MPPEVEQKKCGGSLLPNSSPQMSLASCLPPPALSTPFINFHCKPSSGQTNDVRNLFCILAVWAPTVGWRRRTHSCTRVVEVSCSRRARTFACCTTCKSFQVNSVNIQLCRGCEFVRCSIQPLLSLHKVSPLPPSD